MSDTVVTSIQPHAGGFIVSEAEGLRSRQQITVHSGAGALKAGHVIEAINVSASASDVAKAGNTGNGAISSLSGGNASPGEYRLTMLTSTTFKVESLGTGGVVGSGTVASAFSAGPNFVLSAGGTAFAAGDSFDITVNSGGFEYREYDPANSDAVRAPAGILFDAVDATSAAKRAVAILRTAEVNADELTWFSGATATEIETGRQALDDNQGIVLRDSAS